LTGFCHPVVVRLLKVTRALFGIGQRELAGAAHVSVRELARIEAGEVAPTAPVLERLDSAMMSILERRVRLRAAAGVG
jgi:predicted transcriptional regulator